MHIDRSPFDDFASGNVEWSMKLLKYWKNLFILVLIILTEYRDKQNGIIEYKTNSS